MLNDMFVPLGPPRWPHDKSVSSEAFSGLYTQTSIVRVGSGPVSPAGVSSTQT